MSPGLVPRLLASDGTQRALLLYFAAPVTRQPPGAIAVAFDGFEDHDGAKSAGVGCPVE
jgi:hypothetical protein